MWDTWDEHGFDCLGGLVLYEGGAPDDIVSIAGMYF